MGKRIDALPLLHYYWFQDFYDLTARLTTTRLFP